MVSAVTVFSFSVMFPKSLWACEFALGGGCGRQGDIRATSQGLLCGRGSCGGYLGYCLLLGSSLTAVSSLFSSRVSLTRLWLVLVFFLSVLLGNNSHLFHLCRRGWLTHSGGIAMLALS